MLKKFCIPVILCVFVILAGCDEAKRMTNTVIAPSPTVENTEEQPREPQIEIDLIPEQVEPLELTFENVLELIPGDRYKFRSNGYDETLSGEDSVIVNVYFGSLTPFEPVKLLPGLSADTPKVWVVFIPKPAPYVYKLDGKRVMDSTPDDEILVQDQILIEIQQKIDEQELTSTGGRGGDPFDYTVVTYEVTLVENLTRPDRKFEYE